MGFTKSYTIWWRNRYRKFKIGDGITDWINLPYSVEDISSKLSIVDFNNYIDNTNTSGTNTGDNANNSQYSGLATSKQDTLVSGNTIKTIGGNSILGSGNIPVPTVPTGTLNNILVSDGAGGIVDSKLSYALVLARL